LIPTGPTTPQQPANLIHNVITYNSATVQWTVTSTAYNLETYVVHFGIQPNNLNSSSIVVVGNHDITAVDQVYSTTLTGLQEETVYYYQVVASNSDGSNTSDTSQFTTAPQGTVSNFSYVAKRGCNCV